MQHKLIAVTLCALACALGMAVAACTGQPLVPDAQGIQAIQTACAVDAVGRPIADMFLIAATPAEVLAIKAGRDIIDTICANPGGDTQANALAALTKASGNVGAAFAAIRARKLVDEAQAHGAPPPPPLQ